MRLLRGSGAAHCGTGMQPSLRALLTPTCCMRQKRKQAESLRVHAGVQCWRGQCLKPMMGPQLGHAPAMVLKCLDIAAPFCRLPTHRQVLLEVGEDWRALQCAARAVELQPGWAAGHLTLARAQVGACLGSTRRAGLPAWLGIFTRGAEVWVCHRWPTQHRLSVPCELALLGEVRPAPWPAAGMAICHRSPPRPLAACSSTWANQSWPLPAWSRCCSCSQGTRRWSMRLAGCGPWCCGANGAGARLRGSGPTWSSRGMRRQKGRQQAAEVAVNLRQIRSRSCRCQLRCAWRRPGRCLPCCRPAPVDRPAHHSAGTSRSRTLPCTADWKVHTQRAAAAGQ